MRTLIQSVLALSLCAAAPSFARDLPAAHDDGVWDVEYSADGRYLATAGGDGVVKVWDAATLQEVSHFVQSTTRFQVYDVHFLPDGERVASAALGGKPAVWNLRTGELVKVLAGHEENVVRLASSQDGKLLYTAGSDDSVFAWDQATLEIVGRYHVKSPVGLVPMAETGKVLVVAQGGVHAADVMQGTTMLTWTESPYYFAAAAVGNAALVGGSATQNALPVVVDPLTGRNSTAFTGFSSGFVWNLAASTTAGLAAGSNYQGPAMAWSLETGEVVYDSTNEIWKSLSVAFAPNGQELAVGDTDGSVHFVNLVTGALTSRR